MHEVPSNTWVNDLLQAINFRNKLLTLSKKKAKQELARVRQVRPFWEYIVI